MNLNDKLHPESTANVSLEAQIQKLVRPVLVHEEFTAAATVFLSELATLFGCERACLGVLIGQHIKIAAISNHFQRIERTVLPEVSAAMEEAILQGISLIYPQPQTEFPHITAAHAELARRHATSRIFTVPLAKDRRLIGAITLEFQQRATFGAGEAAFIENLTSDVGPILELKWRLGQSLWLRLLTSVRNNLFGLRERRSQRFRLAVAICLALTAIALFAVPVPNRVSGNARLEASVQRVISVPIDSYLKEVHVRPGDSVKANQVLAELNSEALRVQRRQLEAEAAQHENAVAEAMVKNDRTQAAISRAKLDESAAQLELIDQQLAHTQLVAPFDGVVIKGDLSQLLGAPLKRSEPLLTLSQGKDFRVIIEVEERDIADVIAGQHGTLVLAAFPDESFPLQIIRVTPLATVIDGRNTFEIEAQIESGGAKLVPGLKGVAKIGTHTQPAAWKWIARAWHAITYVIWSRLG